MNLNEGLFFLMVLLGLSATLGAYALGGRMYLMGLVAVNILLANIFVNLQITLFGFAATGGNVVYSAIFLATDILAEEHGKQDARRAVWLGFYGLLFYLAASQITLRFIPNEYDAARGAMGTLFGTAPRIVFASLSAYLLSQLTDIELYHFWKRLLPKRRYLWLRNNGSTWFSQAVDTTTFSLIAFIGVLPWGAIGQLILISYLIKILIAICDTPFLYAARWARQVCRPWALDRS